jgi:hypothetical protein
MDKWTKTVTFSDHIEPNSFDVARRNSKKKQGNRLLDIAQVSLDGN